MTGQSPFADVPHGPPPAGAPSFVALVMEPMCDGRETRNSGLLDAVSARLERRACFRPTPSGIRGIELIARCATPSRQRWSQRIVVSPQSFAVRTRLVERELERLRGSFRVILQFQTLFAPGSFSPVEPYAVFTDNIYALTRRYYPSWEDLSPRLGKRFGELERRTFAGARVTLAKSEFVRRAIIEDYGIAPDRVVTVGSGANTYRPTLSPDGSRYGSATALFVGYDFERKGGATLLEAWPRVRRALPHAELVIVGPEPGQALDGVRWMGRLTGRDRLEAVYDNAAVFVMPSLFEPFGSVFIEAMGRGLACIGAAHCAMPEVVEPNRTGALVPPGDAVALADALVSFLADPDRAEACGREAHRQVLAGRLWAHVGDRVVHELVRIADD